MGAVTKPEATTHRRCSSGSSSCLTALRVPVAAAAMVFETKVAPDQIPGNIRAGTSGGTSSSVGREARTGLELVMLPKITAGRRHPGTTCLGSEGRALFAPAEAGHEHRFGCELVAWAYSWMQVVRRSTSQGRGDPEERRSVGRPVGFRHLVEAPLPLSSS